MLQDMVLAAVNEALRQARSCDLAEKAQRQGAAWTSTRCWRRSAGLGARRRLSAAAACPAPCRPGCPTAQRAARRKKM